MIPRTEEQAAERSPLELKLGEKAFKVKVLPRPQARAWREAALQSLESVVAQFDAAPTDKLGSALASGLGAALLQFPDKLADLVVAWCSELSDADKQSILNDSTDEQIAAAFSRIAGAAYPFFQQLSLAREIVKAGSQKAPFVN